MNDHLSDTVIALGTLNIGAASKDRAARILNEWIIPSDLDVYILTETSEGAGSRFLQNQFLDAGWEIYQRPLSPGDRGVLIASRVTAAYAPEPAQGAGGGRGVVVDLQGNPQVRVVGLYVPNRGNDAAKTQRKREFLRSWTEVLAGLRRLGVSTILAGDLNVVPRTQEPRFLPQEEFEYAWYEHLCSQSGLYDAAVEHASARHESTWVAHTGEGYTYDHILPSCDLQTRVVAFAYDHSTRARSGITDHSALILQLRLDRIVRLHTRALGAPIQMTLF